jgi:hypothetical protein
VANSGSDKITYLRQLYLQPHVSFLFEPGRNEAPSPLLDPRLPPRYQLTLPLDAFRSRTQVAVIPGRNFPLLQGEAARRGRFLIQVTDAAALLRDGTPLEGAKTALLTLRLRDHDRGLLDKALSSPERLRAFVLDPQTGRGTPHELQPGERLERVEIGRGRALSPAVSFPIRRLAAYAVALELDR